MFFYSSYDLALLIIPLLLGLWAQHKVTSAYQKYSRVAVAGGWTGFQAARRILDANDLHHVRIERIQGTMTDHFDPRQNVVRLSDGVYNTSSVAAVGIAAHECGHAVQYSERYVPMVIRGAIVPMTSFGTKLAVPLVMAGLLLNMMHLALIGLIGYFLIAVFQLVTLPVEFNASSRAVAALSGMHLSEAEEKGVRKVLGAAALTYVAALLTAIMQLMRMAAIVGRRR
jgi:hypothetical protein